MKKGRFSEEQIIRILARGRGKRDEGRDLPAIRNL